MYQHSITEKLRDHLLATPAVTAIVGDSIYSQTSVTNAGNPKIVVDSEVANTSYGNTSVMYDVSVLLEMNNAPAGSAVAGSIPTLSFQVLSRAVYEALEAYMPPLDAQRVCPLSYVTSMGPEVDDEKTDTSYAIDSYILLVIL